MKKTGAPAGRSVPAMLNRISHTGLWVTDQDEALAFYRDKLGFEVRRDVTVEEFGNLRWLAMGLPGQDVTLVLHSIRQPIMDDAVAEKISQVMATGYTPPMIFEVDDCRATIEELRARGVDISQEPEEQFYGVDAGIRDPSANSIRITQPAPVPAG